MFSEQTRVGGGLLVQQPSRCLDVGEKERDGPAR